MKGKNKMRIRSTASQFESNLLQTRVFIDEDYAEHKLHCQYGCAFCAALRRREAALKEATKQTVVGVPGDQVQKYREMFARDSKISRYYKNKDDIFDDYGAIDPDVYLMLKEEEFSDLQIRKYFDIKPHRWQKFKRDNFPDWDNPEVREEILNTRGMEALEKWKEQYVAD